MYDIFWNDVQSLAGQLRNATCQKEVFKILDASLQTNIVLLCYLMACVFTHGLGRAALSDWNPSSLKHKTLHNYIYWIFAGSSCCILAYFSYLFDNPLFLVAPEIIFQSSGIYSKIVKWVWFFLVTLPLTLMMLSFALPFAILNERRNRQMIMYVAKGE